MKFTDFVPMQEQTVFVGPSIVSTGDADKLAIALPMPEPKVGRFPSNWRDADTSKARK